MAKLVILLMIPQACWSAYTVQSEATSFDLKIGLAGINPFVYKENDEFHGSDIHMLKILSKKMGFSYSLKLETYDDVFHKVAKTFHMPIL